MHASHAVVYVITKLELGGAQKVCLSLFKNLKEQDTDTILITGSQGLLVDTVPDRTHVILLPELTREVGSLCGEFRALYALVRALRTLKKKYRSVLVHTHSTKAGILGRWAAFCAGIPVRVHTVHGYAFHAHQAWILWLAIYLCELFTACITTHFICVSEADRATGMRLFPRFAQKSSVIRAAVEDHFFVPARVTKKAARIIGTVSCFKPQKNLIDLLRAFKEVYLDYPEARLEIIGDGEERPLLERWIAREQLWHVITLHGWQQQIAPLLAQWDIFALSSLWEGLPCSVIEARLYKLPIIAYDTGGISEVIVNGENGFLVTQKDYHALSYALKCVMSDPAVYHQLAHHADDFTAFRYQQMVAEHRNLYTLITNDTPV